VVTLRSPRAEENQESGRSKDDHDDRHDVGTVFFTGAAQALFKRVGHRGHRAPRVEDSTPRSCEIPLE